MTTSPVADASPDAVPHSLPRPDRWHRPLLALTALMVLLTLGAGVAAGVDDTVVTGQDAWFKPMKFALSIAVYTFTLALLVGALRGRARRVADVAATVAVVGLVIEIVIITGAAAAGTTSHFNVSSPLHTTLWSVMAVSIVVVWAMTLVVGVVLLRNPGQDRARTLAVRAGVAIGIVGMGLAFLMTSPTADQLQDFQGIAGAHAVGAPDDAAGLPFLGWSTVGGDLRVPHFLGIHAVQALPLLAFGLELLARRVPALTDGATRLRLVAIGAAAFAAVLALVTVQALAGQSVVSPSTGTVTAASVVVGLAVGGTVLTLRRSPSARPRGA